MKKKVIPISIVIPTLGELKIGKCIESILSSTRWPREIIVVVPKENYYKLKIFLLNYSHLKIKVLLSTQKNQVYQRVLGFNNTRNKYVMQLDDDVCLQKKMFRNYV